MSKESILGSLGALLVLAFFSIPLIERPEAAVPVLLFALTAVMFFAPALAAAHFLRTALRASTPSRQWADLALGIGCLLQAFPAEAFVIQFVPDRARDFLMVSGVLRMIVSTLGLGCITLAIVSHRRDWGVSTARIVIAALLNVLGFVVAIGVYLQGQSWEQ